MFTSSGIEALGRLSWGTHFCHFYDGPSGIADAAIPYFRAGLDNAEQCLWIAAAPFGVEDARAALRAAVPDLLARERRGEIEIVHHDVWYQRIGAQGAAAIVRDLLGREQTARSAGRRGLRLSANMSALKGSAANDIADVEAAMHEAFQDRHIVALCSYDAGEQDAGRTLDLLRRHDFALTRAGDAWEAWEGSLLGRPASTHVSAALRPRALLQALPVAIYTTDVEGRLTFYNDAAAELWGMRPRLGDARWCGSWRLFHPDGTPMQHEACPMAVALKEGRAVREVEAVAERPDGTRVTFIPYPTPLYDELGALMGAINLLIDISERKQMEKRLELYAREVGHRGQNLLAAVTAILRLTKAPDVKSFVETVSGRVNAFARVHQLIGGAIDGSVGLTALARQTLAAYAGEGHDRIAMSGPELALTLDESQGLAMMLHELATNSVKYGALSDGDGQVSVTWTLDGDGSLRLAWRERGGPPTVPPASRGFGTRLIEATAQDKLKGSATFAWHPEGVVCEVVGTLTAPHHPPN
jgi:PAS domain S-box-containing protein